MADVAQPGASLEPRVPIIDPARQAMAQATALRQAAADLPKDLPASVTIAAWYAEREGVGASVVVQAKGLAGAVVWEQAYDGTGHRLSGALTIPIGRRP